MATTSGVYGTLPDPYLDAERQYQQHRQMREQMLRQRAFDSQAGMAQFVVQQGCTNERQPEESNPVLLLLES